jgi:hypothetical protein
LHIHFPCQVTSPNSPIISTAYTPSPTGMNLATVSNNTAAIVVPDGTIVSSRAMSWMGA